MAKYKYIYCEECGCKEEHIVWTEDILGAEGAARIFTSIMTLGISNIGCYTYAECLNCGNVITLY